MTSSYTTQVDIVPLHFKYARNRSHQTSRRSPRKSLDSSSFSSSGDDSAGSPTKARRRQRNKRREFKSKEIKDEDRFLALDCEMVGLGDEGHRSSLARVCMVNWDGRTILDLYVRQSENVTDYRTYWSGIKAEHLTSRNVVGFEECHRRVMELIRGKILVGHALKNDLSALKITHPWHLMRDTAKYEPFMKIRFNDGALWPRKLKDLAREELGLEIQHAGRSHCPLEDARAALSLFKKVRENWEKLMDYKIKKTREIQDKQLLSDVFSRIDQLDSIFNSRMQRVCVTS